MLIKNYYKLLDSISDTVYMNNNNTDKICFTDLSVSDRIAMLNLAYSFYKDGIIKVDPERISSGSILNALVEASIALLDANEYVGITTD